MEGLLDTPIAMSPRRSEGRGTSCSMSEGVDSLIRDRGEAINEDDARGGNHLWGNSNSIMRSTAPHFCRGRSKSAAAFIKRMKKSTKDFFSCNRLQTNDYNR